MPTIDEDVFGELGKLLEDESAPPPPGTPDKPPPPWRPSLGTTQREIFDCESRFILAHGNRGSGKTFILGGHKLVRHCYDNFNAEALIIVGVRSQATQGGVWTKLATEILPEWKEGLGLKYTDDRMDEQRYRYRYVSNRFGGWSRITLMSLPWGAQIEGRIKGFEPSYIFVDELTTLDSPAFFDSVAQQLGRRPGVPLQQYTAATNPAGPSHWVYNRFFELPWQEARDDKGKVVSREGEWDRRYAVFHLQMEENRKNLNPTYYQSVVEAVRNDPVEYRRMVGGEWVDRPTGDAIFKDYWLPEIHVVGGGGERLLPMAKYPLMCGYDLGAANSAIIFMQCIPMRKGLAWLIFDEMVYLNRKIPYEVLVEYLMRRMDFWNDVLGKPMMWDHVSDDSAFNQYRPGGTSGGSYDVLDVERFSKDRVGEYTGLEPIRMRAAPKFQGSVEARIRLAMALLRGNLLYVSDTCKRVKDMFANLESAKLKRGEYDPAAAFKPKRSVHLHTFDALTYPILEMDAGGSGSFVNRLTGPKAEIVVFGEKNQLTRDRR